MDHSAGIFLLDSLNRVLICTPYGGHKKSNGFTIPKGKKEKGESLVEAAIRETYEECGFQIITPAEVISIGEAKYTHGKKKFHGFLYKIEEELDTFNFECKSLTNDKIPEIVQFHIVDIDIAIHCLHYTQAKVLKKYRLENNL